MCFNTELACELATLKLSTTSVANNNATGGDGGGILIDGDVGLTFSGSSTVARNSGN